MRTLLTTEQLYGCISPVSGLLFRNVQVISYLSVYLLWKKQSGAKPSESYPFHTCMFHLYPISYILYPISCILYLTFYILHPTSYILHRTSYILHLTSYILHPIPYILYRGNLKNGCILFIAISENKICKIQWTVFLPHSSISSSSSLSTWVYIHVQILTAHFPKTL